MRSSYAQLDPQFVQQITFDVAQHTLKLTRTSGAVLNYHCLKVFFLGSDFICRKTVDLHFSQNDHLPRAISLLWSFSSGPNCVHT